MEKAPETISEVVDAQPTEKKKKEKKESRYHNMLESWLEFNDRIVNESIRSVNPIMERINFLYIADNNLDEFIKTKFKSNKGLRTIIGAQTNHMEMIFESIVEELKSLKIANITTVKEVLDGNNQSMIKNLKNKFEDEVYPLIQPMVLKDELPIPDMMDGGFFLVTKLEEGFSGIIQMPDNRLVKIKGGDIPTFVRIDDLVLSFINKFYKGKTIEWNKLFRVFRKIESLQVEEKKSYLSVIKHELDARKTADVVMVDISEPIDGLEGILGDAKKRKRKYPSGFGFLKEIRDLVDYDDNMVFRKAKPRIPAKLTGQSIFDTISNGDVLVHFPYESFDMSTVRLLQEAAVDPSVKVIKQTLYRVSHDSPIITALTKAAHNGKQVVVLLELKAKMDEEHNLHLVEILKKAGCLVIFGPIQLKTHGKITLVIREEDGKMKKYCNISTGNFNDKTARIYEDYSYFCKERGKFRVGDDLCDLFNSLGGCSDMRKLNDLLVAPNTFRSGIESQIDKCIQCKLQFKDDPVEIKIKCNSFTDEGMAEKLYEASNAGVKVSLIVRGMCIVKVGVPGMSDNISCISVVGRYLEHSRVYEFIRRGEKAGQFVESSEMVSSIFIGSGDMMPRNLDYRVEVITPIKTTPIKLEIHEDLLNYQRDNYGSYKMLPTGKYEKPECDIEENMDNPEYNIYSVQNDLIATYKAIEKNLMK